MSTDQFLWSSSGGSDQEIISFKREVNGVYPGARGDEVQIETEDIRNNENYNIYCTDELSARKFLTPKMLEWFDRQISQNAMCVF